MSTRHPPTASPTFSPKFERGGAPAACVISGDLSPDGLSPVVVVEVDAVSGGAAVVEAVLDVRFKTMKLSMTSGALCGAFPLYTTCRTCSPTGTGAVWKKYWLNRSGESVDGEPRMFALPPNAPSTKYVIVLISGVELAGMIPTHMTEIPAEP